MAVYIIVALLKKLSKLKKTTKEHIQKLFDWHSSIILEFSILLIYSFGIVLVAVMWFNTRKCNTITPNIEKKGTNKMTLFNYSNSI